MKTRDNIQKLRDLAEIRIGYPFRGRIHFEPSGEIPVIQLRNFDADYQLGASTLLCVEKLPDAKRHALRAGDVLYASKGERNFAFTVSREIEGAVPASYFFVLHPRSPSVSSEYLAWYINQPAARTFLRSQAQRGTYMPVIPKSVFETLPVPVPPLETQRAIVALDGLQRQEKSLSKQLEEKKSKLIASVCQRAVESGIA